MITLDISPHVIDKNTYEPVFSMQSESDDNASEIIRIQRAPSGDVIATAKQAANPRHEVRFFHGKGGFCAIISGYGLIYFALPGSRVVLDDTEVTLPGATIVGKSQDFINPLDTAPVQQITDQAMILGAGLATRFEPISGDATGYPKPGVPLLGEDAVITIIAKQLRQHGIKRILVNTYYKPQSLKRQLKNLDGAEVVFIDEDQPSGTAGGLAKAFEQGLVDPSKPILIAQGDGVTDVNFSFLMQAHQKNNAVVTIGGQIVPDRDVDKFGIVQTDGSGGDGQSGRVISFKEKPSLEEAGPSRFANAGFYILAPESYPLFCRLWREPHQMPGLYDYAQDFFPAVLDEVNRGELRQQQTGKPMTFFAQAVGGYWSDIGNPTQYLEALHDVYQGKLSLEMPRNLSDYYEKGIVYWPGTKQRTQQIGAELEGNVIVAHPFE